jgi:flagellin-specific chaperone FliS
LEIENLGQRQFAIFIFQFAIFNFTIIAAMTSTYLENEVFSATPQKLRLMLVDGALRFARQTIEHWKRNESDAAANALARCRQIVMELFASVRTGREACETIIDQALARPRQRQRDIESLHEITRNTAAIYLVVLRQMSEAQLHSDAAKLEAVIRVLQVERETLRLVSEQLPHAPQLTTPRPGAEITSTHAAAVLSADSHKGPNGPMVYGDAARPRGSLSLDG